MIALLLLLLLQVDTVVFTGWLSTPGCTYAGTLDGRYIAAGACPCAPERLAYLQEVAPMRMGTTEWYWIQDKRAELRAGAP